MAYRQGWRAAIFSECVHLINSINTRQASLVAPGPCHFFTIDSKLTSIPLQREPGTEAGSRLLHLVTSVSPLPPP